MVMNSKKIEVIPGIFEKDFSAIEKRVTLVSPFVDWIQIDIADNKLVPNNSLMDPEPFHKLISETNVNYELHMMIEEPLRFVDDWISVGFRRVLLHVEGIQEVSSIPYSVSRIKNKGVEVGIAVDKNTPVEVIFPCLDSVDCVLIMTIAAGFSGQKFIPELLEKVSAVRKRKPDLPIEVDGGINDETAKLAIAAGANRLVSTSFIFNSENIGDAIEKLRSTPK